MSHESMQYILDIITKSSNHRMSECIIQIRTYIIELTYSNTM